RIVAAIETLHGERLPEHLERLGHHALRGGLWEKAVGYLRQAGWKSVARSANAEAASHFEQALMALGRLTQTGETRRLAIDLRFDLRAALIPIGATARLLEHLTFAEELARNIGDE